MDAGDPKYIWQVVTFWLVVLGAGLLKVRLSPWDGIVKAILTLGAAVFMAAVFTDPVLAYFGIDPEMYRNAVAALVAITGESIARWVMKMASNPTKLIEFFTKGK